MVMRRTGTVVKPRVSVPRDVVVRPTSRLARLKIENLGTSNLEFSKFLSYASNVLTDTTFVMFFVLSAYLCYDYSTAGESSHVVTFVNNFVTQFTSFKANKCGILNLLLVAVPFVPAILTVSSKNRFGAVACAILYYVFVPERTVYEYLIHGAIVYLILRTNVRQYRLIGVALLFLSYVMQFTVPLPTGTAFKCNATV